jgi:hypothetical protein
VTGWQPHASPAVWDALGAVGRLLQRAEAMQQEVPTDRLRQALGDFAPPPAPAVAVALRPEDLEIDTKYVRSGVVSVRVVHRPTGLSEVSIEDSHPRALAAALDRLAPRVRQATET